jgi:hypothetical protein
VELFYTVRGWVARFWLHPVGFFLRILGAWAVWVLAALGVYHWATTGRFFL